MGAGASKLSPEAIHELQKATHFDRKEIQNWHRSFLRDCPSGVMRREDLLAIYQQFFPFGDPSAYCSLLFPLLDRDGDGFISFGDYLQALSMASRGRVEERVKWAFQLYDRHGRGLVTRDDLVVVVDAIYRLLGSLAPEIEEEEEEENEESVVEPSPTSPANRRVDRLFAKLQRPSTDELTVDDLLEAAQADPLIVQGLLIYDGLV